MLQAHPPESAISQPPKRGRPPPEQQTQYVQVDAGRNRGIPGRPLVAHLTTLRPDGTPHTAPVWFLWDAGRGAPGHALVMAYDQAVKVRNLGGNPAATLSVATPDRPYAFVSLEGRASLDPAAVEAACHRICEKYDGPQRGPRIRPRTAGRRRYDADRPGRNPPDFLERRRGLTAANETLCIGFPPPHRHSRENGNPHPGLSLRPGINRGSGFRPAPE